MHNRINRKKIFVWSIAILAFVILAIYLGLRLLKKDLQSAESKILPVATKQIRKLVASASDSLYTLNHTGLKVNLDSGYVLINQLKVIHEAPILQRLIQQRTAPDNVIDFSADRINVNNIRLQKVQSENALRIGSITLLNPKIVITNKLRGYNDTINKRSWFNQLVGKIFTTANFDAIVDARIDRVVLKNATVIYTNLNHRSGKTTSIKNVDVAIRDITTDALANKPQDKQKQSIIRIGHQRLVTSDGLYYVDFTNMRINPAKQSILIDAFELRPTLSKVRFVKAVRAKRANWRYHIRSTGIAMDNIDFQKLSRTNQFYIPLVTVQNSRVEYYSNYKWPLRTPPNRRGKYPHELLQGLAVDVTIPKMVVRHADMYFRIIAEKTGKQAFFSMNNVQSVTTNITNNVAAKKRNPFSVLKSSFLVMNKGLMQSTYKFNLNDKNGGYTVTSTLGALDGTVYNPLLGPLAMMEVRSLNIRKMKVDMTVNEYEARGNIDFYYNDYKVRLLKKENDDTTRLKNRALVSLTSNIILPNDNPKRNGKFRKGPVYIIRDPRESFFGFQWRAVLDGLSSSMTGADQDKDKPKNKVTRLGKLIFGPGKGQETKSTGGDKERLKKVKVQ